MRIILADDEPIILEDLRTMLKGYENIEIAAAYTDSTEVIEEIYTTKPDCAILDIEMAGLSGIELAEKLISVNPNIEVVFVTAYNNYAAQAFEVNAIDYLLKPIRPERLDKAIKKVLMRTADQPAESPRACKIKCFGSFEVTVGTNAVKWSRSKSKELFAYLLQNEGKWISKYKLCDVQWQEYGPDQALAYLQTSIYALRKNLKQSCFEGIKIEYSDDRYRLKVIDSDWDLRLFEQKYEDFMKTGSTEAGILAMDLYQGEYLEGEDWHWSDLNRGYYERKFLELQKKVNNYSGHKDELK